ncbi:uncharacterized protein V1518DRAFT_416931 [Limtongia smithiae]|uniref:uncharacterized protein n=1 Tax=Limtongia smithiae TaxID=1125753 RepID=UPI0034CE7C94
MILSPDIRSAMESSLLYKRENASDVTDKVVSFAQSFKSWSTCMDNTGCKVIAIVGIVLAVILVFSIVTWIIRIIWCGASAACWICCKCCSAATRDRDQQNYRSSYPQQQPYYPPQPPVMSPYQGTTANYRQLNDDEIEMGRMGPSPAYKREY